MPSGTEVGSGYKDMQLPSIIAPALRELTLSDMWLAPVSGQLSWLAGLPKLRRLVLEGINTTSSQPPHAFTACRSLTELVLEGVGVRTYYQLDADQPDCSGIGHMVDQLPASWSLPQQADSHKLVPQCFHLRAALLGGCHSTAAAVHERAAAASR